MKTKEEELKEPKLLWKGTTQEAIDLGKVTQEDVDRWNRNDEEGESYSEGYDEGLKKGKQQTLKDVENKYNKIISEDLSPKQLLGITIFFRRIMGFEDKEELGKMKK
jgi:flagellar biosynthesis/type III secretory pathway protein FliH